jgi:hypothetical protein
MNLAAVARARGILDELRAMLPDHTATIDALARKLEAAASRVAGQDRAGREGQPIADS